MRQRVFHNFFFTVFVIIESIDLSWKKKNIASGQVKYEPKMLSVGAAAVQLMEYNKMSDDSEQQISATIFISSYILRLHIGGHIGDKTSFFVLSS